jgi:hypothetical protein
VRTSCRRKSSSPGNVRSRFKVLLVCALRTVRGSRSRPARVPLRVAETGGESSLTRGDMRTELRWHGAGKGRALAR